MRKYLMITLAVAAIVFSVSMKDAAAAGCGTCEEGQIPYGNMGSCTGCGNGQIVSTNCTCCYQGPDCQPFDYDSDDDVVVTQCMGACKFFNEDTNACECPEGTELVNSNDPNSDCTRTCPGEGPDGDVWQNCQCSGCQGGKKKVRNECRCPSDKPVDFDDTCRQSCPSNKVYSYDDSNSIVCACPEDKQFFRGDQCVTGCDKKTEEVKNGNTCACRWGFAPPKSGSCKACEILYPNSERQSKVKVSGSAVNSIPGTSCKCKTGYSWNATKKQCVLR